ncbi:hypothetical protein GTR04_0515 [Trichophyton interdigitale]|uniref:Transcription factor hoxa13 n=1 Tax=Trichophyton interdigitale TaxID=101480 RepID=A0A9P4YM76_9EURO|nr:hypothetical protein GY631_1931 [Trichophyton interdigitale]KAF3901224.1 hypothetical protein GY632_0124 [Trichophyton interdigitale]KAG8212145.1 hypothetical protein GTR04_0515 [Trichophyton interdigitale]
MDPDRLVKVEDMEIEEDTYLDKPVVEEKYTRARKKKAFRPVRGTISVLLRLFVWYSIFIALFRCPSSLSELNDESPRVCKPYIIAKTRLEPYISPYYHKYAAEHVEHIKPYAQSAYKTAEKVYIPTAQFSKNIYQGHVSIYVDQAMELAKSQWNQKVSPHTDPLQAQVTDYYTTSISPRIKSAQSIIIPYFWVATEYSVHINNNYVVPAYIRARPVIHRVCATIYDFVVTTIAPYIQEAWSAVVVFLNGTVRPHIRTLYSENVEPQLVKIGEKLASYREGRTIQQVNLETASSVVHEAAKPSTHSSVESRDTRVSSVAPPATTKLTPAQQTALAREKISTDLKAWKERTTSLASKGLEHVQTQVRQVVEDVARRERPSGEDMLARLESVADEQLYTLTQDLYSIIQAIPVEYTQEDEEKAQDAFLQRLRESSHSIRGMAHSLRLWYNKYQETLTDAVTKTINITLEVLENARELGLQEIGMRWTAIDGVTYKDWANYHELKSDLGEWKDDIRQAGLQHDSFILAKDDGENIVARGMDIALDAARQLAEIRSIGKLKIEAGDTTRQLNVDHINDEMIENRKKYMITSVTSTSTVAPSAPERSDASEMLISNETEADGSPESPVAEIPVAESLEAEVETPPGEEYVGEQPKSALLEETIQSDETLEPQPTPEAAVILEEAATTAVIPEGSSPGFTSMVEEPVSSDPANSGKSSEDEVIDVMQQEHAPLHVDHETPEDTIEADETVSLPSEPTSSTIETEAEAPIFVTQAVDDTKPEEPEDTLSQTTEHTPSTSPGEPLDVHEMVGSATDKIISLVDSAKAGLSETPIPKNEASTLMQDASTKLGDIVSSVQSSISSLEATPPSESSAPEQRREHIRDEISRLTAALEAAQAALLELYRSDEPGQTQESTSGETAHEYNEGHY